MTLHKLHVIILMNGDGIEEEYFVKQNVGDSEYIVRERFEKRLGEKFKSYIFDAMYYGKQNCTDGFYLLYKSWRIN